MDYNSALQKLASYRLKKHSASKKIFDDGLPILDGNAWSKQNDGWDFLESLALAAIELERFDVSDRCIQLLQDRFPDSPRLDCLSGIRLEATESADVVLSFYDDCLRENLSVSALWRRKVAVLKSSGKMDKAVQELSELLDTFYTDVEGWVELAEIYYLCNQYPYALQALSHALLLAPQNPFYVLQFAEIAYAAQDIPLSIKMYLMAVDMTDDEDSPIKSMPSETTLRSWYGVKLCTTCLFKDSRLLNSSASQTPAPKNLKLVDELATERLRSVYKGRKGVSGPSTDEDLLEWASATLQPV